MVFKRANPAARLDRRYNGGSTRGRPRLLRMKRKRVAIVLSEGGARGAYEAGVLSWLFEHIYPRLRDGFEFDIVSGTSVGAIHSAYIASTAHLNGAARARPLLDTW